MADRWPAGISDGLTLECRLCGDVPKFDYVVIDELWDYVVPEHAQRDVFCLPCLDQMAWIHGRDVSKHLKEVQFTGKGKTVVLHPAGTYRYDEAAASSGS